MTLDLVLWTKNGEKTLPLVLKRISKIIPLECVNERIIVDDASTDNTEKICQSFGWKVIPNNGAGVGDGANTALKIVKTGRFISFEQDLVLATDWWDRIPNLLNNANTVIASGLHESTCEVAKKISDYSLSLSEKHKRQSAGRTLDNTIYKTSFMRSIGGFPKVAVGLDAILKHVVEKKGYEWKVDYGVKSLHLRNGLLDELKHYRALTRQQAQDAVLYDWLPKPNLLEEMKHFFFSPFRGLDLAVKKSCPQAVFVYPLMRLLDFRSSLHSGVK